MDHLYRFFKLINLRLLLRLFIFAVIFANAGQIDHPTPDETDHLRRSKLTTKNRSKLTT